jgi:hypothetical protein
LLYEEVRTALEPLRETGQDQDLFTMENMENMEGFDLVISMVSMPSMVQGL